MIKFWSYQEEYKKYKKKLLSKINKTIKGGSIFFGRELEEFEKAFIKKYKFKYGVAVGSGTDALLLSLKTLSLKPGDEVITAANTAIPTISAIVNAGGIPRLVDVGEDYLINVKKIENEISKKTKAIIPVHLYGQMCDMDEIIKLSKKYNLSVIEDCAQAQGALYKNKFAGSLGNFGCFSFYPTKILGAYGDGGFISTNNYKSFLHIKKLRFYGIETEKKSKFKNEYYAEINGYNSRLDEIQSTILNFKLKKTEFYIKKRIELAKIYSKKLNKTDLKLPIKNKNCKHVYHLFTVRHKKASLIKKLLMKKGIQTRTIYPYPIHKMNAYSKIINNKQKLINSSKFANEIFCLPLYPYLKLTKVRKITDVILKVMKNL